MYSITKLMPLTNKTVMDCYRNVVFKIKTSSTKSPEVIYFTVEDGFIAINIQFILLDFYGDLFEEN